MLAKLPAGVPAGVFLIGKAVGDFELVSGRSAKGTPYSFVKGQVLAGRKFVNVNQSLQGNEAPLLFRDGDDVLAEVVPNFKANGVLSLDVKLERPEVGGKK